MISTPFLPVPPPRYGGTELVVWELVEGLAEAGHEVVLFTAGPSQVRVAVEVRRRFAETVWPPDPYIEVEHAAWAIGEVIADGTFDVMHVHCAAALPLSCFVDVPMVYTLHHERVEPMTAMYARHPAVQLVAISHRQRELLPELDGVSVVWHGLEPNRYPLGPGGGAPVFLGRLAREKGVHSALDAAERAGVPLTVAGQPHWKDEGYFNAEVEPRMRLRAEAVRWVGEVAHVEKVPLLGQAPAFLFPIDWEEPFGLVMIEAMLCGTPVLALGRGAAPEVIEPGVTGWICEDVDTMAERLRALCEGRTVWDRARCRARAVERFGRHRMAREYVEVYERALMKARWQTPMARIGDGLGAHPTAGDGVDVGAASL
ncbi:MAG TPA: glycosyltransferase family 4 protein [Polyangia bacterium]|nr:glycosyltransferase family 4 protein [Polyangia bacterium]